MNSKRYVKYSLVLLVALLLGTACTDDEFGYGEGDGEVMVSFRPRLDAGIQTRAIGDGTSVNRLDVLVFEGDELVKREEGYSIGTPVNLTLFEGRSYKILFWAQYEKEGSKPYSIADDGTVTVDYENFSENGYESLDAFYAVDEFTVNALMGTQNRTISLNRPLAQLNFADVEQPQEGAVTVSLTGLVTSFNPFAPTSSVVSEEEASQSFTFTSFPEDGLVTGDGEIYRYVASMYLFPATVDATISFNEQTKQISDIPLETNKRTNVIGTIVQEPEDIWNGEEPTEAPVIEEDCYIIDSNEDLAWLAYNEATVSSISIEKDLNMGNQELGALQLLPNTIVWGNGHTIKNLYLNGALFGDATSLTVENVSIVDATVSSDNSHVGVLVNTLIGGGSFSGITVTNASVITTNGAAGGLVGYVVRETEQSRDKTLDVSFSDCTLSRVHVSGTSSEGKFVGRLSGYDHGETLHFGSDCSVDEVYIEDYVSPYTEGNEATWLADNDYLNYDGWLGDEEYCRGTVKFDVSSENPDGIRFIPRWDGVRTVEPLTEDGSQLIYSAFDLASLQKKTHTSVTFMENVDMASKIFNPIYSISTLEGNEMTLYNLKVDMIHDGSGAAFIQTANGTTTHKNLTFVGADIKNVHDSTIPNPEYGDTDDGGAGNAYAGTIVSHCGGTYHISNVHVRDGKVYAVCKMGGLVGYVGGVLDMQNCSVDNYVVENYEPNVPNYYEIPPITIASSFIVHGLQWWYTNGECGGLIGFIKSTKANIHGCSVTNTNIKCKGQPNKNVIANVWDKSSFEKNPKYTSNKKLTAKASTMIAGRHINQFIGDVVSARKEGGDDYNVTVTDYTVKNNSYDGVLASETNEYNHQYASDKYCDIIGCAYYVGVDVDLAIAAKHIYDCAGTVTFNPKGGTSVSFTESVGDGNNMAWTGGDFKNVQITVIVWSPKSEYPAAP